MIKRPTSVSKCEAFTKICQSVDWLLHLYNIYQDFEF